MGRKSYPLSRRRLQAVRKRYRMRLQEARDNLNNLTMEQLEQLAQRNNVQVPDLPAGLKKAHTISRLLMRLTEQVSLNEECSPDEVEAVFNNFMEEEYHEQSDANR